MLKRLFLVATSAVCLAALAAVGLYLLAGGEAEVLAVTRRTLQTEVAAVEAEWRRTGAEVAQMATATAADATLGADVRALVATVDAYNPDAKLAKALGLRIDALRSRLSDRLLQLRHINPEVESIALMSTDGLVLAANSPRWAAGQSVLPSVGGTSPTAPLPEFMLKGLTGSPQSGLWVDKNALWWVSVAPIWVHGPKDNERPTLAGVAVLEQPLRSLPPSVGASAFLMLDGQPLLGQPPKAMRAWPSTPEPFLLLSRATRATLLGETFPLRPFFVEGGHVGVWAQRLHVPGTDRAQGVVTQDLTDAYAAMATRQVQFLAVVVGTWLLLAAMLARRGWHLERDVHAVSDFLLTVVQGNQERKFPEATLGREAQRLGLVVNKLLALVPLRNAISTRPAEGPFGPTPTGELLADAPDPVAVVKSFMGGDALGTATRAGRPLLGNLSDTAPRGAPQVPVPEPVLSTPNSTVREDPDEDTGPIDRLPTFLMAPALAESASPPRPEPAATLAPMLGGSARDQLMAMLQAKAKKPAVRDTGPVRPVAPEAVPELHAVSAQAPAAAVAAADSEASGYGEGAYDGGASTEVYELDDSTDRSADERPLELAPASFEPSPMMEGYEPAAASGGALPFDPAATLQASPMPLDPNLMLDGAPGDAAEPTPVLELAAQPLGLEAEPIAARDPLPFPPLDDMPAYSPAAEEPPTLVSDPLYVSPAADKPRPPAADDGPYRAVFNEFVRLRSECGEAGELPYNKFVARLESTRADVLAKHNCQDVRFSAYIKNGKAALKVTPV